MKLIVVHSKRNSLLGYGQSFVPQNLTEHEYDSLLRYAICGEPFCDIVFDYLGDPLIHKNKSSGNSKRILAIPESWADKTLKAKSDVLFYKDNLFVPSEIINRLKLNSWFVISSGRYVTRMDEQRICRLLAQLKADVIAVNVTSKLRAANETILTTSQKKLIGFRRYYGDLVQLSPLPEDWPHHLFIKTNIFNKLLTDSVFPLVFSRFIDNCTANSLSVRSLNIGGVVLDLKTEQGLLEFFMTSLASSKGNNAKTMRKFRDSFLAEDNVKISESTRIFGKVLLGQNVSIGQNVIITGPAFIGDGVKIAQGVVINRSVIGSDISIPRDFFIQNRVLIQPTLTDGMTPLGPRMQYSQTQVKQNNTNNIKVPANSEVSYSYYDLNSYRSWPKCSYAGCIKRIADIILSLFVLILFAPIFLLIAIAIKLSSQGPVFFKDKRQGMHGKTFKCIKFRTMLVGADKIQDKLRILNEADGPQFKMANDPRINAVGKFLRDTYIDEIPQFFNVLIGEMSVVGPRPSPESENTLCPSWRDARLSVRPGITGLWQICRTRQPMKDFQEWIYYDIKYVRNLSLKMDIWLCWQTLMKMIGDFINQF